MKDRLLDAGLALAWRALDQIRFQLTVDHKSSEVISKQIRRSVSSLRAGEGLLDHKPGYALKWSSPPDVAGSPAGDEALAALLEVLIETLDGLSALTDPKDDELLAAADCLTRLVLAVIKEGLQPAADASTSADPWERRVGEALAARLQLPPALLTSAQRVESWMARVEQPFVPDPIVRDLWRAVARGERLPDGSLVTLSHAVAGVHVINRRLLVRIGVLDALRAGVAQPFSELPDDVAAALPYADRACLDVLPTLLDLAPWQSNAASTAANSYLRQDASRLDLLLEWTDVESSAVLLSNARRYVGPILTPKAYERLRDTLLNASIPARRAAAACLLLDADTELPTEVVAALAAALEDADEEVRQHAAEALTKVGHAPVDHPDASVRYSMAYALGEDFSAWAATQLARLLDDPVLTVRRRAYHSLNEPGRDAFLPDPDTLELLRKSKTAQARWWHFRLAQAHPASVSDPFVGPSWATCTLCRFIPLRAPNSSAPEALMAQLVPPIVPKNDGTGESACPHCGRRYRWRMTTDDRGLWPQQDFLLERVFVERAEGYAGLESHPEPWVQEEAKAFG